MNSGLAADTDEQSGTGTEGGREGGEGRGWEREWRRGRRGAEGGREEEREESVVRQRKEDLSEWVSELKG